MESGAHLVTYDGHFDNVPGLPLWQKPQTDYDPDEDRSVQL
jgi:hypothetical protein